MSFYVLILTGNMKNSQAVLTLPLPTSWIWSFLPPLQGFIQSKVTVSLSPLLIRLLIKNSCSKYSQNTVRKRKKIYATIHLMPCDCSLLVALILNENLIKSVSLSKMYCWNLTITFSLITPVWNTSTDVPVSAQFHWRGNDINVWVRLYCARFL